MEHSMKKLSLAIAAIMAALVSLSAQAVSVSNTFNVTINLTALCTITTPANVALAYTSFQLAAVTGTTQTTLSCTTSLPYTLSLNGLPTAGVYSKIDASTGLTYTLAFNGTGLSGADMTGTGTGVPLPVTIGVNIAGGQSGSCTTAGGVCNGTAQVQTLYVTY